MIREGKADDLYKGIDKLDVASKYKTSDYV
jgi:hypothetical protein